jgi:hypothetical protein
MQNAETGMLNAELPNLTTDYRLPITERRVLIYRSTTMKPRTTALAVTSALAAGLAILHFSHAVPLTGGNISIDPDTISNGGGRLTDTSGQIVIEDSIGGFASAGGVMTGGNITLESDFAGGLFNASDWFARYNITPAFFAANAQTDTDKDGIPLVLEAAFNLNPNVSDAWGAPVAGKTGDGKLTIEVRRNSRVTFNYRILSGPGTTGPWTDATATFAAPAVSQINADTDRVLYTSLNPLTPGGHKFYRVEVTKP